MTYINTLQTLASAFILGILLQCATGMNLGFLGGYTKILLQHRRRLALVMFLTSTCLWAKLAFLDFAMPSLKACQGTIILSTISDQLARTTAAAFILCVGGNLAKSPRERTAISALLAIRSIMGVIFVGFTRPQLAPLCTPRSQSLAVSILVLLVDAMSIAFIAVREARIGVWKDAWSLPCTTRKEQNKANALFILGYTVWFITSIPKVLGLANIPLFVRVAVPALGLYFLLALIDAYRGALLRSIDEDLPEKPSSGWLSSSKDVRKSREINMLKDDFLWSEHESPKNLPSYRSDLTQPSYPSHPRLGSNGQAKMTGATLDPNDRRSRPVGLRSQSYAGPRVSSSPLAGEVLSQPVAKDEESGGAGDSLRKLFSPIHFELKRPFARSGEGSPRSRTTSSVVNPASQNVLSPRLSKALPRLPQSPQPDTIDEPISAIRTVDLGSAADMESSRMRGSRSATDPLTSLQISPLRLHPPSSSAGLEKRAASPIPLKKGPITRKQVPSHIRSPSTTTSGSIPIGHKRLPSVETTAPSDMEKLAGAASLIKSKVQRLNAGLCDDDDDEITKERQMREGTKPVESLQRTEKPFEFVPLTLDLLPATTYSPATEISETPIQAYASVLDRPRPQMRSASERVIFPRPEPHPESTQQKSPTRGKSTLPRSVAPPKHTNLPKIDTAIYASTRRRGIPHRSSGSVPSADVIQNFPVPRSETGSAKDRHSTHSSAKDRYSSAGSVPRTPASQLPPTPPLEAQAEQANAEIIPSRPLTMVSEPMTPMPPSPTSIVSLDVTPLPGTDASNLGQDAEITPPMGQEVTLMLHPEVRDSLHLNGNLSLQPSDPTSDRVRSISAPPEPQPDTLPSWHHRIGDQVPTFSNRSTVARPRSASPPAPLQLRPSGRGRQIKAKMDKDVSPASYVQKIQNQLRQHEPPNPLRAAPARPDAKKARDAPELILSSGKSVRRSRDLWESRSRAATPNLEPVMSSPVEMPKDETTTLPALAASSSSCHAAPKQKTLWCPPENDRAAKRERRWTYAPSSTKPFHAESLPSEQPRRSRRIEEDLEITTSKLWGDDRRASVPETTSTSTSTSASTSKTARKMSTTDSAQDWMTRIPRSKTILVRRTSHKLRRQSAMRDRRVTFLPEILESPYALRQDPNLFAAYSQMPGGMTALEESRLPRAVQGILKPLPPPPMLQRQSGEGSPNEFANDDGFDESTIWEIAALLQPQEDETPC